MNINWPDEPGKGSIICDGSSSCRGINFPFPQPFEPYILLCDSYQECGLSDIFCPKDANCAIECTERYSCFRVCNFCLFSTSDIIN